MANIVTYPLNKIEYQATDAELFHATRTSGVYASSDFRCSVTGANNIVTVGIGIAWIKNSQFSGKVVANKSNVSVDLGIANASLPRWDVVCLQFDKNKNATDIVVKKGAPLSSPVMPAIVQTETLYELYLCKVYRPGGAVAISTNDVYDLRLDPELCGLMADSVTRVDTSAINAQINALIEQLKEEIENATSVDKGINTYTASGTVNNFTLTGIGENGKFKANFTGLISSAVINGEEYTVLAGNETEIELSINSWYTFVLDYVAKTINFKSGGGLSSSKLAETTAVLSDVVINKTFFSKTKELKTGTLADKSGTTQSATPTLDTTNSRLQMTVPATGKYSTTSKLYAAYSNIRSLIGLTASKIVKGNTILGLAGTGFTVPTYKNENSKQTKTWAEGEDTISTSLTLAAGTWIVVAVGIASSQTNSEYTSNTMSISGGTTTLLQDTPLIQENHASGDYARNTSKLSVWKVVTTASTTVTVSHKGYKMNHQIAMQAYQC